MSKYLLEITFTLQGIKGIKEKGGTDRLAAATELIEGVGGKIESYYFAFGGIDAFVVAEFPDDVTAMAVALTVGAAGGATTRTVSLLTPAQVDAAAKKNAKYRPPGS